MVKVSGVHPLRNMNVCTNIHAVVDLVDRSFLESWRCEKWLKNLNVTSLRTDSFQKRAADMWFTEQLHSLQRFSFRWILRVWPEKKLWCRGVQEEFGTKAGIWTTFILSQPESVISKISTETLHKELGQIISLYDPDHVSRSGSGSGCQNEEYRHE